MNSAIVDGAITTRATNDRTSLAGERTSALAGSNGVGDIAHELAYLNSHTSLGVTLATGTEPFAPNRWT